MPTRTASREQGCCDQRFSAAQSKFHNQIYQVVGMDQQVFATMYMHMQPGLLRMLLFRPDQPEGNYFQLREYEQA